jgi:DNA-binding transcriptional ArsR family regulator
MVVMTEPTPRQITDLRALSALSHPLRRRMMDVLKLDGPATASRLAERTGQAVGNISHHLKVLAGADLVEEVPELARDRRERWWRLTSDSVRWSSRDFADDTAAAAVAAAALSLNLDRHLSLVRESMAAAEHPDRNEWQENAFAVDRWLRLTPDELGQVSREVIELFDRWSRRETPDDGRRREPVFVFAHGVPAQP